METYIIKKGDTLSAIARKYKTTVKALAAANEIKNVSLINVGQVIQIPGGKDYSKLGKAVNDCLTAIEQLPEYQEVMKLL